MIPFKQSYTLSYTIHTLSGVKGIITSLICSRVVPYSDTILNKMNQRSKNKLKMYQTVQTICTQNQAVWANLLAFVTVFAQFSGYLVDLEQFSYNQQVSTIGVTAHKNQLLAKTTVLAELVVNALRAYASSINDAKLTELVHISKWEFKRGGSQFQLQLLDRILEIGTLHLNALADFGIQPEHLDTLEDLRLQLGSVINSPRTSIVERKSQTTEIAHLMKAIDTLLTDQMDHLVTVLKATDPQFYQKYHNARTIVDYRGKTNEHGAHDPETPTDPDGFNPAS